MEFQASIFDTDVVKLSTVLSLLKEEQNSKNYWKRVRGEEEDLPYKTQRENGEYLQINCFYRNKKDVGGENVIKYGVYLAEQKDGTFRMTQFDTGCLNSHWIYRNKDGSGKKSAIELLKIFSNNEVIVNDLGE